MKLAKHLHKLTLFFYSITLAIICQVFLPNSAAFAANTQNFKFESYDADYYLTRDEEGISHLRVIETLTAVFPNFDQNHGITRYIPFTNQAGKNITVADPDHFSVKVQQNGVPTDLYEIWQTDDGYYEILIGDPDSYVRGRQVYTLEYNFENVIADFEDYQELYWDTNGVDWQQAFGSVTVRLHLGYGLTEDYTGQAWCYTGHQGSNAQKCTITQDEDVIEFSTGRLGANENLTIDLEFKPDSFTIRTPKTNYILLLYFIGVCLIGAGVLTFTFFVFRQTRARRQFYKNIFVKPEYTPPIGITVAEAAECYMKYIIGNSKVATLLELAVHHDIELIQNTTKKGKKQLWTIRIKNTNLTDEQKIVLQLLRGKSTPLTSNEEFLLKNHTSNSTLMKLVQKYPQSVKKSAKQKGLFESDDSSTTPKTHLEKLCSYLGIVSAVWVFLGIIATVFVESSLPSYGIIFGHIDQGFSWLDGCIIGVIFAVFLCSLVTSIFCSRYAVRTEKGLTLARYLEGLKLYIKMAEADRLKFLQSVKGADTSHQGIVKLYEKLLPYAIIFRLEDSWLKEMGHYYEYADVAAPTWYVGIGAFSARDFSQALHSATTSANSSFISASPSGSSSGFSGGGGGGFSGGGGGGGGGGGW